jgi:hypothetical protein
LPRKISAELQEQVRRRADFLCEYCHANERWQYVRFTIDHVVAGGPDTLDNLALACFHCNRRKSDKTALFNPRAQRWGDHFQWSLDGLRIVPLTELGRITVETLDLSRDRILPIRQADVAVHRHPPADDPSEEKTS